jgi:hypothetical protein
MQVHISRKEMHVGVPGAMKVPKTLCKLSKLRLNDLSHSFLRYKIWMACSFFFLFRVVTYVFV